MKTARFVRWLYPLPAFGSEIALSARMSTPSFAGSPQCAFTLTKKVAVPAAIVFHGISMVAAKISTSRAPTNVAFPPSPIYLLTVRGVVCIRDIDCTHLGFATYLARICYPKVRCVNPSKWPFRLRTSVPKKTLACIRFRQDPSVHPFSESIKINIWIRTSQTLGFTTGFSQQP